MDLFWLAPVGSIAALLFAVYLVYKIMQHDEGAPKMKEIAQWVKEGAMVSIVFAEFIIFNALVK